MQTNQVENSQMIRLNTKRIPTLPPGSNYLMQAMMDESLNFRQLAQIVEKFPSIAARLIALSNSAWSAPISPITSLEQSCSRLGFGVVRSTSIALSVSSPFDTTQCPSFDTKHYWSHLLLVADTATWLAQSVSVDKNFSSLTARSAGLLHDLGLLWLADQIPEETHQAILLTQEDPKLSLSETLTTIAGINYQAAGSILAEAWNLPEPLIVAMYHKSTILDTTPYREIVSVVNLADCLVTAIGKDTPCPVTDNHMQTLGIKHEDVGNVMQLLYRQKDSIRLLADQLFNHTP
ncbi:MAG: HDOD domain-containing protein [Chromatiales bacterium]|jgi:HD-like signal output (HDOD) protein